MQQKTLCQLVSCVICNPCTDGVMVNFRYCSSRTFADLGTSSSSLWLSGCRATKRNVTEEEMQKVEVTGQDQRGIDSKTNASMKGVSKCHTCESGYEALPASSTSCIGIHKWPVCCSNNGLDLHFKGIWLKSLSSTVQQNETMLSLSQEHV